MHDELTATALVLEDADAERQVAIIACDLLYLGADEVAAIRAAVSRLTNMLPHHVVIACSHTHYGPTTRVDSAGDGPEVAAYLANLAHLLAGAVLLVRARSISCRLGVDQGQVRIGVNRRGPAWCAARSSTIEPA